MSPAPEPASVALPNRTETEALIEEARRRARWRRARNAAGLVAAGLLVLGVASGLRGGGSSGEPSAVFGSTSPAPSAPVGSGRSVPQRFAFNASGTVWVAERDGKVQRLTRDSRRLSAIAWAPDGRWLLARMSNSAYEPGESLVRVSHTGDVGSVIARHVVIAALSPDGRQVAFIRAHWHGETGGNIYVVPVGGGHVRRVATNGRNEGGSAGLAWSPNGRAAPLPRQRDQRRRSLPRQRCSWDTASDSVRPHHPAPRERSFSPNGSLIAFGGYLGLPNGQATHRSTSSAPTEPPCVTSRRSLPPDRSRARGRIAFIGLDRDHRFSTINPDGAHLRRLGTCRCDLRGPGSCPASTGRATTLAQLVGTPRQRTRHRRTDPKLIRTAATVPPATGAAVGAAIWRPPPKS